MDEVDRLKLRKAKLEKQIRELRVQQSRKRKKLEARKKMIVGGAILAAVEAGDVGEKVLEGILKVYVSNKSERAFLGLDDEPDSE